MHTLLHRNLHMIISVYLFKAMDAVLGVEVKRLDEDNEKEVTTNSILDTDEADTGTLHQSKDSRTTERDGGNKDNEGERDAGGSVDNGEDDDDRMLSEDDIETKKTYVIEFLCKMVDEIKALPVEIRFNEQGHMHQSIQNSSQAFFEALTVMDVLPLDEADAFCLAVAELMVSTGYYEFSCECLMRTLHYTTSKHFQNQADDAELSAYIDLSLSVMFNFTDESETLRTALANFPGYLDACRAFLDWFEEEYTCFENMPSSVS